MAKRKKRGKRFVTGFRTAKGARAGVGRVRKRFKGRRVMVKHYGKYWYVVAK